MPFFPSVIVPLLWGEEIKPPPACPLVRTLELMTCPGWGVPGAAETSQLHIPFLSDCSQSCQGWPARYSFLAVKRGASPNSGLKETVRLGNFFLNQAKITYIFLLEVLNGSLRPSSYINVLICTDQLLQSLRGSDSLGSGHPEAGRLPPCSPSD